MYLEKDRLVFHKATQYVTTNFQSRLGQCRFYFRVLSRDSSSSRGVLVVTELHYRHQLVESVDCDDSFSKSDALTIGFTLITIFWSLPVILSALNLESKSGTPYSTASFMYSVNLFL